VRSTDEVDNVSEARDETFPAAKSHEGLHPKGIIFVVVWEFTEIQGPHSGENLAEIVLTMLGELEIAPKLLTWPMTPGIAN
jgi:hypothetical protein